jgi:mannose-6-phosphate isomerase-like protein (cupin superfamily)
MGERLALNPTDSLEVISAAPEALVVEATYAPGGSPPPAHFHPEQDERFEVLAGAMRAVVDAREVELAQGAELEIARGQVHRMWNPGEEQARTRWVTTPAGRTLDWFRTLDRVLGPDGAVTQGREVDFQALLEEYRDVFRLDLG